MKTELYTNCSLVRVPIKAGVDEYYLPQNVEWANRKIERIAVVLPSMPAYDPMDGETPVMGAGDLADCYFNIYDSDNKELMHDVSFEQILSTNNNPLYLNAKLNLSLCRIVFTTSPVQDATLLLYVYYGTRTEDYFDEPKKSISVQFELDAYERMTFQELINNYVSALPAKIQGLIVWSGNAYITLRDTKLTYQMANVHTELCRPDTNGGTAEYTQAKPFYINDLDIDFDYSNILNATDHPEQISLTFLYN